jgi:hypothetical protein
MGDDLTFLPFANEIDRFSSLQTNTYAVVRRC